MRNVTSRVVDEPVASELTALAATELIRGFDDTSMLEVAADGETRLALLGPRLQPHDIA